MIRKLTLEDLQKIIMLDKLALNSNWHLSDYRDEIINEDSVCLGLELEGELFGYIIFRQSFLDAELMQIMIHPDQQGKLFGTELMDEVEQLLFSRGVSDLHLEVREDNEKARKFYRKLGFIEVRTRMNYYGSKRHAKVMRKRLVR